MSDLSQEQLIEHIAEMSVLDLSNLVKALEEKFGVSAAAAAVAMPAGGAAAAEPAEEKTEFDVILKEVKDKIKVLKEVRVITGLGIKEAKELVESAGDSCKIKEGLPKAEAEEMAKKLTEVGGTAVIA